MSLATPTALTGGSASRRLLLLGAAALAVAVVAVGLFGPGPEGPRSGGAAAPDPLWAMLPQQASWAHVPTDLTDLSTHADLVVVARVAAVAAGQQDATAGVPADPDRPHNVILELAVDDVVAGRAPADRPLRLGVRNFGLRTLAELQAVRNDRPAMYFLVEGDPPGHHLFSDESVIVEAEGRVRAALSDHGFGQRLGHRRLVDLAQTVRQARAG